VQVPQLKAALRNRGIRYPAGAKKAELVEQLRWADSLAQSAPADTGAAATTTAAAAAADAAAVSPEVYDWDSAAPPSRAATAAAVPPGAAARFAAGDFGLDEPVVPGIRQFEAVASAGEAEIEKEAAGENRAVEHVAMTAADVEAPEELIGSEGANLADAAAGAKAGAQAGSSRGAKRQRGSGAGDDGRTGGKGLASKRGGRAASKVGDESGPGNGGQARASEGAAAAKAPKRARAGVAASASKSAVAANDLAGSAGFRQRKRRRV
jgi:HeH/LEM domain